MKRKCDWKFTLAAFIAVIAFMVPATYVHELGHGAICKMQDLDFEYTVGLQGGVLECPGIEAESKESILMFYFAGGATAAEVFFAIGALGGKLYRPIRVAAFTIGTSNLMVAFLETFAHGWYVADIYAVVIVNLAAFVIWFAFLVYYHPKRVARTIELGGRVR